MTMAGDHSGQDMEIWGVPRLATCNYVPRPDTRDACVLHDRSGGCPPGCDVCAEFERSMADVADVLERNLL